MRVQEPHIECSLKLYVIFLCVCLSLYYFTHIIVLHILIVNYYSKYVQNL